MNVYIIDDEQVSLFLTRHMLTSFDSAKHIATFTSAETALENLVDELPGGIPQVIFLDLNMPGMSGWDFLSELVPYEEHLLGRCRIYILTSSLDTSDLAKANEEVLISGFIHKPIRREDIEIILSSGHP